MAVLILMMTSATITHAGSLIRIGDIDGFGYGVAPGFRAANGGPANLDGVGVLDNKDFLPDINRDGNVATGSNDEFDFRSTAEINNASVFAGVGVTSTTGTTGSKYTDISLARTYDARSAAGQVLIGGNPNVGLVRGTGGPFPDPSSDTLPNQPGFVFNFVADKSVYPTPTPIFFNLIFGDYDVTPANVTITLANNSTKVLGLTTQDNSVANGLIQAATVTLLFSDVFTDGGSVWNGSLKVDFVAPNEPYTAFDYVELSTVPLIATPEPPALSMMSIGLTAVVLAVALQRRSRGRVPRPGLS